MATQAPPDGWVVTAGTWGTGIQQSTTQTLNAPSSVNISAAGISFVGPWVPISPFLPYSSATNVWRQVYTPSIFVYGDNASNNITINWAYYNATKAGTSVALPFLSSAAPPNLNEWNKLSKYIPTTLSTQAWGRWEITSHAGHTGNFYIGGTSVLSTAPFFNATGSASIASGTLGTTWTSVAMSAINGGNLTGLVSSSILLGQSGVWNMFANMAMSTKIEWQAQLYDVTTGLGFGTSPLFGAGGGGAQTINFATWAFAQIVQIANPYELFQIQISQASGSAVTCTLAWSGSFLK